ncbi:putative major head protein [Klebsiella phage vB_KaeM_LilPanda]|nr:putative major head protein [Klebsiella phage vB_KaeM_LilPanda]
MYGLKVSNTNKGAFGLPLVVLMDINKLINPQRKAQWLKSTNFCASQLQRVAT